MQDASVVFEAGLNVVVGPSDTGKTYIAQCINYMLGGSKPPKQIPAAEGYDQLRLTIDVEGDDVSLERSLTGGGFRANSKKGTRTLAATHSQKSDDTLSAFLLAACGLSDRRVRTNEKGKTRPLSFRDVVRLFLVDEESMISEQSPAHSGQFVSKTAEVSVFRMMLTGVDDSSVVEVPDARAEIDRGKAQSSAAMKVVDAARERVADQGLAQSVDELNEQLKRVEKDVAEIESRLRETRRFGSKLEEERRSSWVELRRVESRLAVLQELGGRFALLREQYLSDLARLEFIREAGGRLGEMGEERCPICGAPAQHHDRAHADDHVKPSVVADACSAEAGKIEILLGELKTTQEENDGQIGRLESDRKSIRKDLGRVEARLNEDLRPRVERAVRDLSSGQEMRQRLQQALALKDLVTNLENVASGFQVAASEDSSSQPFEKGVGTAPSEAFARRVEGVLKDWRFPNLGRVTFDPSTVDLVVSGQGRGSYGKGVRAITHAAFTLGLLVHCRRSGNMHPGLVILDSPLIVYRQPDPEESQFSHDVKERFYSVLADQLEESQVIVLENDAPPDGLEEKINVIEFTGSAQGRQGFIPAVRS